jgi:multidrug resistance efflux pump
VVIPHYLKSNINTINKEMEEELKQLKEKITTLSAKATFLKGEADRYVQLAQEMSMERLDVLEEAKSLAIKYHSLKANP